MRKRRNYEGTWGCQVGFDTAVVGWTSAGEPGHTAGIVSNQVAQDRVSREGPEQYTLGGIDGRSLVLRGSDRERILRRTR